LEVFFTEKHKDAGRVTDKLERKKENVDDTMTVIKY